MRDRTRWIAAVVLIAGAVALLTGCFGPIERPVADFSWCPDGSEGRLDYWFTSLSTTVPGSRIERLEWDFGDGSPPIESLYDGTHRFDEAGLYLVTLTVVDSRGVAGTVTKQVPIELAAYIHPSWQLTLGFPPTVSGIVENRFDERLTYVVVRARFYDADGVRLTDGRFEIMDLDPGEKAAFAVRAEEFTTRIFHATVDIDWFSADCRLWFPVIE
jgi:hypothetical protein